MNCPLVKGVCYGRNCGFYTQYGCAIENFGSVGIDFFLNAMNTQQEAKEELKELRQEIKEIKTMVKGFLEPTENSFE
jgi:hypothetical protein